MRTFKEGWRFIALLLVALVFTAVAACGDDDDDDDATDTGAATATATGGEETDTGGSGELLTDFGITDDTITLGQTNDLAGTGGTPYGVVTPAMVAYFNKVNEEDGGVCGRNIELIAEDDQYQGPVSLDKMKKLVEQDEVAAIVGALGTGAHLAVVDYLNDPNGDGDTADGVPDLYVATGYSGWGDTAKWPWTTGYIPDYISDGTIQGQYILDNLPDAKVGILYQNDAFGQDYLTGLDAILGDKIVSRQPYEASATEVSSQILTIENDGADVLFLAATPRFAAGAITAASTNGYTPAIFQSYVNAATNLAALIGGGQEPAQIQAGFAELEGIISTNYILDPIADAATPAIVEHTRIMQDFDGPTVSSLSVFGQGLGEFMVHTLEIACENGDMTRAGILAAAESIQGFHPTLLLDGIDINLSADDHYAVQALMPVEIQADGTLSPLADEPINLE